ncbi:M28 family peptidase [Thalassotalea maritima]|uniref:M28 family peptidase n=1 Tax=Thalassotalea maritima TaxID=3242416 RepID=UPI003529789E
MTFRRLFSLLAFSAYTITSTAQTVTIDAVSADMQILASDDMRGRAIGSPEIAQAERYIVAQLQQHGLQPLASIGSYRQAFTLNHYQPTTASLRINGTAIDDGDIALSGNMPTFSLTHADLTISQVGKEQDLRGALSELNERGGKHLVLIDETHRAQFLQYRNYLAKGKKALTHASDDVLVLAMAPASINQDINAVKRVQLTGKIKHKKIDLANIVAVLPAQTESDEYVIFSAHHDHVGATQATDASQDVIYNGANDDATGVSAVLNLARAFSQAKDNGQLNLQRNIMFVSFTAEESGLIGSNVFVEQVNTDNVVAMLNIEMIGKASQYGPGRVWMTGFERSNLGALLNSELAKQGNEQHAIFADPYPNFRLFYRSDNASLAKKGVPAHSISSTQIDQDKDYHKVTDEIDTLDLVQMTDIINNLFISSKPLLEGTVTPKRLDKVAGRPIGVFF